jgi:hypothetical protein
MTEEEKIKLNEKQNEFVKQLTLFKSPFSTLYYFFLEVFSIFEKFFGYLKRNYLKTIFILSFLSFFIVIRFFETSHQKVFF